VVVKARFRRPIICQRVYDREQVGKVGSMKQVVAGAGFLHGGDGDGVRNQQSKGQRLFLRNLGQQLSHSVGHSKALGFGGAHYAISGLVH
jgi:hypothetical protein